MSIKKVFFAVLFMKVMSGRLEGIVLSILLLLLLLLVGFRSAQLSLSTLSRKVLQSAVASRTSNPQLAGEPGI
jgi:hypothetical protein